ncbi:MAG: branched-chain amino acid ABC transporter permease [Geodermatophilaceae bacterium]
MSAYTEAVIVQVGIAILLALAYWINAATGKYSFGHAAFMAIGAYTASILTLKFDWSLEAATVVAGFAAAIAGAFIGWIALRLTILYLAIITFAFAEIVKILLDSWDYVGGASGLFGMRGTTIELLAVCIVVVVIYLLFLTRSRKGLSYEAIREDEQAARACGLGVTRISVEAFAVSAAITGVAGALSAHETLIITPSQFGAPQSLLIILFVVLGGVQYFWGAIAGAIVLTMLPIWFDFLKDYYQITYGLLFVVLMILRPQGIIGRGTGRRFDLSRLTRISAGRGGGDRDG